MPTMGGLAIFVAFNTTNFFLLRDQYPLSQLVAKIQINVIGKLNQPRETTPRNGKVKVVILILAIK